MKRIFKYITILTAAGIVSSGVTSCNNFLEIEPESFVTPESYFTDASQLLAYLMPLYEWLPEHGSGNTYGLWKSDAGTDNTAHTTPQDRNIAGYWQVTTEGSDAWDFTKIYKANYFLEQALAKYEAGEISGSESEIEHHIGEGYFFRAYAYFDKLQNVGDYPIVEEVLETDFEILELASERRPRNEVARFILSDLDKAIELMGEESLDGNARNLLSKSMAQLLKSRVALFEACWERYFEGTAFVPGGTGWPGSAMDYNVGRTLYAESGSISAEVEFFLKEAIEAADALASKVVLTENSGIYPQSTSENNEFFNMFGDTDMSGYPEILLWRAYNSGLGFVHKTVHCVNNVNLSNGATRSLALSFLDVNGLPYYASGSLFTIEDGEGDLLKVRLGDNGTEQSPDRDNRVAIFFKSPNQLNALTNIDVCEKPVERNAPPIYWSNAATTGYMCRKGGNFDGAQDYISTTSSTAACPSFRSTEAMLNYMEAYVMLYGSRGGNVDSYWEAIRTRAGIKAGTIDATINAIDMSKEAETDWGAYSAGQVITDKTLFAIRKERRNEFFNEGLRYMDLCRWRSMDQLIDNPYHIQGMKLWNCDNEALYDQNDQDYGILMRDYLIYDGSLSSTVSSPDESNYLRPYRKYPAQIGYSGLTWRMAHYLYPIELEHMMLTSDNADYSTSPIYQNPYWPLEAGATAEQ
ncbi:MAG: RagB/SusD family nutrient uptake outer membrane protein [Rikenellaceae bacterium]